MLDENNGWAVGSDAVLRYSSGQWQPFPHPSPIFPESVATVSDKDAWILEGSRVLQFTGTEWQLPQSLNDVQRMMDITMLDESTGWAVGFNGIILRYDGQEWSRAGSPTSDRLYSVSFGGGSNGWAVGGNYPRYGNSTGTVLHYVAGQWITVDVPGIPALTSVSGTPDGSAWAMSPEGIAVHLYADGTHEAFNIPRSVKSVDMVSDSEGWAVGDNGLILHFTPGSLPTTRWRRPVRPARSKCISKRPDIFLSYGFLTYWRNHGGLAIFGYPITEEFTERNPLPPAGDGKEYTYSISNGPDSSIIRKNKETPYETQLGLLGQNAVAGRLGPEYTPPFTSAAQVPADTPDRRFFAPQKAFSL